MGITFPLFKVLEHICISFVEQCFFFFSLLVKIAFPKSAKNVTDFFRSVLLTSMFQRHFHNLQTQHWCISYFDKNIKISSQVRKISHALSFSKIVPLIAKHFDGEISERSNDLPVCGFTNARGKRPKALYKKKRVCTQFL